MIVLGGHLTVLLKFVLCLPSVWSSKSTDESIATTVRQYTLKPPVDLHEILYNGSWVQFCDRNEIDKDSPPCSWHPLRTVRLEICHRQSLNRLTRSHLEIFVAYKYSVMARSIVDEVFEKLVKKYSEEDDEKRALLYALDEPEWAKECVMQSQETLRVNCIDRDNPYFMMFYRLICRICTVPWLRVGKIQKIMKEECDGMRVPRTEWEAMQPTIHFKE